MVRNKVLNTILLVSDEAMPNDLHDEVPSRLLSLFTSPVIGKGNLSTLILLKKMLMSQLTVSVNLEIRFLDALRSRSDQDWQDVNNDLEIAYVKNNDTPERIVSLIGMYSEHSSKYPSPIKSLFDDTFWEELPVMTHETFRFYMENLGMYVAMLAIPDLADKYNTKIGLSTAGFEEWCPIMASELAKL